MATKFDVLHLFSDFFSFFQKDDEDEWIERQIKPKKIEMKIMDGPSALKMKNMNGMYSDRMDSDSKKKNEEIESKKKKEEKRIEVVTLSDEEEDIEIIDNSSPVQEIMMKDVEEGEEDIPIGEEDNELGGLWDYFDSDSEEDMIDNEGHREEVPDEVWDEYMRPHEVFLKIITQTPTAVYAQ